MLVPAMRDLIQSSVDAPPDEVTARPIEVAPGRFRIGDVDQPVALRVQIGHCSFASPDAELLVPLLAADRSSTRGAKARSADAAGRRGDSCAPASARAGA